MYTVSLNYTRVKAGNVTDRQTDTVSVGFDEVMERKNVVLPVRHLL